LTHAASSCFGRCQFDKNLDAQIKIHALSVAAPLITNTRRASDTHTIGEVCKIEGSVYGVHNECRIVHDSGASMVSSSPTKSKDMRNTRPLDLWIPSIPLCDRSLSLNPQWQRGCHFNLPCIMKVKILHYSSWNCYQALRDWQIGSRFLLLSLY